MALECYLDDTLDSLDSIIDYGAFDVAENYSMPMITSIWSIIYEGSWVEEVIESCFKTAAIDTWRCVHLSGKLPTSWMPQVGGIMCYGNDNGGRAEIVLHTENDGFTAITLHSETEEARKFSPATRNLADGPARRYVKQVYLGTILPPLYVDHHQ